MAVNLEFIAEEIVRTLVGSLWFIRCGAHHDSISQHDSPQNIATLAKSKLT